MAMFRTMVFAWWYLLLTASCSYNDPFSSHHHAQNYEPRYPIVYPNHRQMSDSYFRMGENRAVINLNNGLYGRQNLPVWLLKVFERVLSSFQSIMSTTLAGLFPKLFTSNSYFITVSSTTFCTVSTSPTCATLIRRRAAAIEKLIHHIEADDEQNNGEPDVLLNIPGSNGHFMRPAMLDQQENPSVVLPPIDYSRRNLQPLMGSMEDANVGSQSYLRQNLLQQAIFLSQLGYNTLSFSYTITSVITSRSTPKCSTSGTYSICPKI